MPEFVAKAAQGRAGEINTCIACNQACLDHIFEREIATVPRQSVRVPRNRDDADAPTQHRQARRGRRRGTGGTCVRRDRRRARPRVTLFDAASEIGGQFNLARRIPGKEEFAETLRYFDRRLAALGVERRLGTRGGARRICAMPTR